MKNNTLYKIKLLFFSCCHWFCVKTAFPSVLVFLRYLGSVSDFSLQCKCEGGDNTLERALGVWVGWEQMAGAYLRVWGLALAIPRLPDAGSGCPEPQPWLKWGLSGWAHLFAASNPRRFHSDLAHDHTRKARFHGSKPALTGTCV